MNTFSISPYQISDNEGAKALCRIPVSGNIVLSLEREPDYLAGAFLQCEQPEIYVCRDTETGQVCGLFNVGFRRVFMNGVLTSQRYYSDLRIDPAYQKSRLLFQIVRFLTKNNLVPQGQDVAQTIVFTDNTVFQDIIQKRKNNNHFLNYHFASDYLTQIIALSNRKNPFKGSPPERIGICDKYKIKKATKNDVSRMQSFSEQHAPQKQGYPFYDYSQIASNYYQGLNLEDYYLAFEDEKLVGFCAVWHQKGIKQTRIVGYSRLFSFARPFVNVFSKWIGGFQLPSAGSILNYFYIHNVLIENNKPAVFIALLHQITEDYRHRGFHYFMSGFCADDVLLSVFEKIKNKRTVEGKLYWVNNGTMPASFLDNRRIYAEIGRF